MITAEPQPSPRPIEEHRRFPLLRYFSVASLICTLITAVALGMIYRRHAIGDLMAQAERESATFAQVLSFTLRNEVAALLRHAEEEGTGDEVNERIERMIRVQAKYFNAAKVKIYARDGTTVFSTVKTEIGQHHGDNIGVARALRGEVVSSLVRREQFNAFDRILENRDLLQTYLPVPGPDSGEVIGVFELYSDMTGLLAHIRSDERVVIASLAGILLLLYGVLFMIVRRADRIIEVQDGALQAQVREINRYNLELEDRVRERTGALEEANRNLMAEIGGREAAERELDLARQRAWQQDKLAAIGRLAAGIVHEIGNPLAALGGLVNSAQEELSNQQFEAADRDLLSIKEHIRRLESITRDVSGFSVPQTREPEPIDLNGLVNRGINVMHYDAALSNVMFDLDLDPGLPAISGIPDQLLQMLMNLVLNAGEAIRRKEGARPTITVTTVRQGDFALLTVHDQGDGMNEDAVAKAFEPFQTTKAPGEGMGTGLSLCHAVVQSHGGEIAIESNPKTGTAVIVKLPLADLSG